MSETMHSAHSRTDCVIGDNGDQRDVMVSLMTDLPHSRRSARLAASFFLELSISSITTPEYIRRGFRASVPWCKNGLGEFGNLNSMNSAVYITDQVQKARSVAA